MNFNDDGRIIITRVTYFLHFQLIHFLIAMVKSPSKGLVPKRKFSHLALEGGEESSSSKINTLHQFSQGSPLDVSRSLLCFCVMFVATFTDFPVAHIKIYVADCFASPDMW